MRRREAKLQSWFSGWLKRVWGKPQAEGWEFWMVGSAAFELKCVEGEKMSWRAVTEEQMEALNAASATADALVYKISDMSMGAKPFDCFAMSEAKAYVVLGFSGGAEVWMVEVGEWRLGIKEWEEESGRNRIDERGSRMRQVSRKRKEGVLHRLRGGELKARRIRG